MAHVATVGVEPAAAAHGRRLSRRFYVGVGVAVLVAHIVAFAPAITVDASQRLGSTTPVVAVHAVTSLLFLLTFIAQAALVAAGRTAVHRRLGILGAVLAAAMVVLGVPLSVEEVRRGYDLSGDLLRLGAIGGNPIPERMAPGPEMMTNFSLFSSFGILVALALWYRNRSAIHKRLMLLAMVGVLPNTPIAHLIGHYEVLHDVAPLAILPITVILLSVSAVHDRLTERRIHPVSIWGAALLFAWSMVWQVVIIPSPAGDRLARWLIS
jgi:hypothetical protein